MFSFSDDQVSKMGVTVIGIGDVASSAVNILDFESFADDFTVVSLIAIDQDLAAPQSKLQLDLIHGPDGEKFDQVCSVILIDLNDALPGDILGIAEHVHSQSDLTIVIAIDEVEGEIAEGLASSLVGGVDCCILLTRNCVQDFERKISKICEVDKLVPFIYDKLLHAVLDPFLDPEGLIGIDLVDVKSVLDSEGFAVAGFGVGTGGGSVETACAQALDSPLLQRFNTEQATTLLDYYGASSESVASALDCTLEDEVFRNASRVQCVHITEHPYDTVILVATGLLGNIER